MAKEIAVIVTEEGHGAGKVHYSMELLEACLNKFHKEHPGLHKKQTYKSTKDIESESVENFLYWLRTSKYKMDHNWTYGSF
jgi:hypothetical protein